MNQEWKYIEKKDSDGNEVDEKRARDFFGVRDTKCPCLELENGWIAVWFGQPLDSPTDYPALSSAPTDATLAKAFKHV